MINATGEVINPILPLEVAPRDFCYYEGSWNGRYGHLRDPILKFYSTGEHPDEWEFSAQISSGFGLSRCLIMETPDDPDFQYELGGIGIISTHKSLPKFIMDPPDMSVTVEQKIREMGLPSTSHCTVIIDHNGKPVTLGNKTPLGIYTPEQSRSKEKNTATAHKLLDKVAHIPEFIGLVEDPSLKAAGIIFRYPKYLFRTISLEFNYNHFINTIKDTAKALRLLHLSGFAHYQAGTNYGCTYPFATLPVLKDWSTMEDINRFSTRPVYNPHADQVISPRAYAQVVDITHFAYSVHKDAERAANILGFSDLYTQKLNRQIVDNVLYGYREIYLNTRPDIDSLVAALFELADKPLPKL